MDPDARTRIAIEEHWRASELGDGEAEHAVYASDAILDVYASDAILDYPQSGERPARPTPFPPGANRICSAR